MSMDQDELTDVVVDIFGQDRVEIGSSAEMARASMFGSVRRETYKPPTPPTPPESFWVRTWRRTPIGKLDRFLSR